jgi:hypothetical protein
MRPLVTLLLPAINSSRILRENGEIREYIIVKRPEGAEQNDLLPANRTRFKQTRKNKRLLFRWNLPAYLGIMEVKAPLELMSARLFGE